VASTVEAVKDIVEHAPVGAARSLDAVEALRPAWERIRFERIDADIDFYLAVVRSRGHVLRPHVVLLRQDAGAEAIAVARVEDVELTSSIGYRVVARPCVRSLTVVPEGVVGADSPESARRIVEELLACLARGEADVALLPALRTDSHLYRAATEQPSALCRERFRETTLHHRLRLPTSLDELLGSKSRKSRGNLKRQDAHFRQAHPDVMLEVLRHPGEEERLFRDLDAVAAKTYQRGLGVSFRDTEEQRSLIRLGLARGWYRAYVLSVGGSPIAFWPGFAYNGTFFLGTPGYDPAYEGYNVGTFLLLRVIEDLCADESVAALDYGFGDADYKRRFGNECWEEADVLVFAPKLRAARINLVRTGVTGTTRLAKRVLGGERADRIKRRWRGRLARREDSAQG
jgi:CelD/BcsL family acetyltransferase involved in cellulose biosynthesis